MGNRAGAILPTRLADERARLPTLRLRARVSGFRKAEQLGRIVDETPARPKNEAARAARRMLDSLQSLGIADVLRGGLHEFLLEVQDSLDRIGDEVVQMTMFYPEDYSPDEQQQQQ